LNAADETTAFSAPSYTRAAILPVEFPIKIILSEKLILEPSSVCSGSAEPTGLRVSLYCAAIPPIFVCFDILL
jgi:hypothetical protein